MNKRGLGIAAIIVLVVIVAAVGYVGYRSFGMDSGSSREELNPGQVNNPDEPIIEEESGENIVEITSSGFSPDVLEIQAGEKVTWVNLDSGKHWPASAMHPTHRVYPGSDIDKCGTPEEGGIFDACHGLEQSEEYEFIFSEAGEWRYHDHLRASMTGTIIVSE